MQRAEHAYLESGVMAGEGFKGRHNVPGLCRVCRALGHRRESPPQRSCQTAALYLTSYAHAHMLCMAKLACWISHARMRVQAKEAAAEEAASAAAKAEADAAEAATALAAAQDAAAAAEAAPPKEEAVAPLLARLVQLVYFGQARPA